MIEVKLLIANGGLSKRLYQQITTPGKNTFFSPIDIHSILTLISQVPWFYTEKQTFNIALLVEDVNKAAEHYKNIIALLNNVNGVTLLKRNTAYLKSGYEVQEPFKICLTTNFTYKINPADFTKSDTTAKDINKGVEDVTKKITHLVDSNTLNNETRLLLINGTYFSGKWAKPFNAENTTPATFYLNDNDTMQVQMMRLKGEFNYTNDPFLGCKILELPYVNDEVSLIVVLPNGKIAANYLESQLPVDLIQITNNLTKQEVDVSLPKFKVDDIVALKKYLSQLGLDAVNTDYFDIGGNEDINVNNILQKSFLDVDEAGTEAGSALVSNLSKISDEKVATPKNDIIIQEMTMKTDISNRFAKTKVLWTMKNVAKVAINANFKVVLTETAFITQFVMEIGGKSYQSYIKEKEEAKNIYNQAVASGKSAGLVEASARDSKEFTVSVNLEPATVGIFTLTYEEMLTRVQEQYELVLNICPGQIIDNLNIEVIISESRPLKFVKVPPLRSGNDISVTENVKHLDPLANLENINPKSMRIKFQPNRAKQRNFAHYLGGRVCDGLTGQFIVMYDIERDPRDGEILLQDGYFVHFFAPNDLDPLSKHVLFVLDTSGSMSGRKMEQLKDAMMSIISDLRKDDLLSIIEFNSDVAVWDINSGESTHADINAAQYSNIFGFLSEKPLPEPLRVSKDTIVKAKDVVQKMQANGSTFMIGGLETALFLVKQAQTKYAKSGEKHQPIMVFLTDGQPNIGISSTEKIVEVVTSLNMENNKVPIFSLSFGQWTDKHFLRKLSLNNFGFSRHIYEAADASLQLQQFYKQISSPLLSDINFKYDVEVEEVTRIHFPIYFQGSELVVAGKYKGSSVPMAVNCCGCNGPLVISSMIARPVTSLERLWAYLTVKQLLDDRKTAKNVADLTKRAVRIALQYSFVTEVTSLVVVKPDVTKVLDGNAGIPEEFREMAAGMAPAPMMMCSSPVVAKMRMMPRMGGGETFGSPPQAFGSASTGFGSAAISSGQTASLFGSVSRASPPMAANDIPVFGSASTGFGSAPTVFGSGATGFGTTNVFGSVSKASPFTAANSTPAFGSASTGFGSATTGFGSGAMSFGTPSVFGSVSKASPFTAANSTPAFGSASTGFGSAATGFGSGAMSFGTPSQFGNANPFTVINRTPAFGSASTGFGSATTGFGSGAMSFGTPSQFGNANPFTVINRTPDTTDSLDKKTPEVFVADHPFMIILRLKKENKTIILFKGCVYKPTN